MSSLFTFPMVALSKEKEKKREKREKEKKNKKKTNRQQKGSVRMVKIVAFFEQKFTEYINGTL